MARTLFFLEAALLLLASSLFSLWGHGAFAGFALPVVASVLVPLIAASAVWPLGKLRSAFAIAFTAGRPGASAGESMRILEALAGFSGAGAAIGALGASMSLLSSLGEGGGPRDLTFQALAFGLFGVLYAMTAGVLRQVVASSTATPANGDIEKGLDRFARRYGLTPREREVAAQIALGRSYQEAADALFISIKTVKTHISRVYGKAACRNKVALVLLLREETAKSYERPMVEGPAMGEP